MRANDSFLIGLGKWQRSTAILAFQFLDLRPFLDRNV
jgi:hypothetical protein